MQILNCFTFASMYLLHTSYLKKTGAMLFLVLFVFVHAIKALHTHEISAASSHYHIDNTAADIKVNFFCSICDFQIAKDSDAVISQAEFIRPQQNLFLVFSYTLSVHNAIIIVSSGTDPPLFA